MVGIVLSSKNTYYMLAIAKALAELSYNVVVDLDVHCAVLNPVIRAPVVACVVELDIPFFVVCLGVEEDIEPSDVLGAIRAHDPDDLVEHTAVLDQISLHQYQPMPRQHPKSPT